jgi:ribose 5-phosphate isomerase B
MKKTIVIGSDHAGFPMKSVVIEAIQAKGFEVLDVGSYTDQPVDFPDIARDLCKKVLEGTAFRGIMVCGTGVGAVIATNKIRGIRSAMVHDIHCAHQCVEHDDVNVMCVGAKIIGPWLVCDLVDAFLGAKFNATEEHVRRVQKLADIESSD